MKPAETIYLDNAATTAPSSEVRRKMLAVMEESWANPSSVHALGRLARREVEEAREAVAASLGSHPRQVIFTSGATEANNMALRGILERRPELELITSPLEHSSVIETARRLEREGKAVHYLTPTPHGELDLAALRELLDGRQALVALMLINNETGVRSDIARTAEVVQEANGLLFCDAVQGWGFERVDVRELGVDALSISAHKAHGPKGVGALWLAPGLEIAPLVSGGEQERGYRPGTHDVAAIAGMGVVATHALESAVSDGEHVGRMRDLFESELTAIDGVRVNGLGAARGPKQSSVSVAGVDGETLLMSLDSLGLMASAGSACAAGSVEPSHVLTAMGLSPSEAKASIRFSFGTDTSESQVREAARRFAVAVERCRRVPV